MLAACWFCAASAAFTGGFVFRLPFAELNPKGFSPLHFEPKWWSGGERQWLSSNVVTLNVRKRPINYNKCTTNPPAISLRFRLRLNATKNALSIDADFLLTPPPPSPRNSCIMCSHVCPNIRAVLINCLCCSRISFHSLFPWHLSLHCDSSLFQHFLCDYAISSCIS